MKPEDLHLTLTSDYDYDGELMIKVSIYGPKDGSGKRELITEAETGTGLYPN